MAPTRIILLVLLATALFPCCRSISEENDAGWDTDCGQVDEICCDMGAQCSADLLCVVGGDPDAPDDRICLSKCTAPTCANIAGNEGTCLDVGLTGSNGVCMTDEDFEPSECTPNHANCATWNGASTDTICVTDGEDSFCLEICVIANSGCDDEHHCVQASIGTGVCVPD